MGPHQAHQVHQVHHQQPRAKLCNNNDLIHKRKNNQHHYANYDLFSSY